MNGKERFKNITLCSKMDCGKKKVCVKGADDIPCIYAYPFWLMVSGEVLGSFNPNYIMMYYFQCAEKKMR